MIAGTCNEQTEAANQEMNGLWRISTLKETREQKCADNEVIRHTLEYDVVTSIGFNGRCVLQRRLTAR